MSLAPPVVDVENHWIRLCWIGARSVQQWKFPHGNSRSWMFRLGNSGWDQHFVKFSNIFASVCSPPSPRIHCRRSSFHWSYKQQITTWWLWDWNPTIALNLSVQLSRSIISPHSTWVTVCVSYSYSYLPFNLFAPEEWVKERTKSVVTQTFL